MRIIATITAEEKNKTLENILFDPCIHIKCHEIDCETCPLWGVAEALRSAQGDYVKAIDKIEIEG